MLRSVITVFCDVCEHEIYDDVTDPSVYDFQPCPRGCDDAMLADIAAETARVAP